MPSLAELIAEGDSVPVEGFDFSWFAGRATEERPSWGYARLLSERIGRADAVLDIQTGGGEVLAEAVSKARAGTGAAGPAVLVATESWPPNLALAAQALAPEEGVVDRAWLHRGGLRRVARADARVHSAARLVREPCTAVPHRGSAHDERVGMVKHAARAGVDARDALVAVHAGRHR
jgi:hypothetical protein